MESSMAEFIMRWLACELLPTWGWRRSSSDDRHTILSKSHSHTLIEDDITEVAMILITTFTSRRTSISPVTKGCREKDASMRRPYLWASFKLSTALDYICKPFTRGC